MTTTAETRILMREQTIAQHSVRLVGEPYNISRNFTECTISKKQVPVVSSSSPAQISNFAVAVHSRLRFLRFATTATTCTSVPGLIPPYCPLAPTLSRAAACENAHASKRVGSPLRQLALSNYSLSINCRMPHGLSMPHSGFQALILCGPGIGLSTFTSVPNEFPKALVNVANRPMVWYVLDWCYRMGVTDITLVTPPSSKAALAAALAQNPYLTSLPSPSPNLLAPADLDHTTPTAELLRLPEVQTSIKSDFVLLPCDLICEIPGETFIESYLTSLGGLGGVGTISGSEYDGSKPEIAGTGGERGGRRGGLSIWYNTANREESVKHEECDFMCTTHLDPEQDVPLSRPVSEGDQSYGVLRKLAWTMPMSELKDECEEKKSWQIRESLLTKYGSVKCLTKYRDSHIYFFPYWVKDFAKLNKDFESVSEDLVGTWAKSQWRKPSYRARFRVREIFGKKQSTDGNRLTEAAIEEELDLFSLSTTATMRHVSNPPSPSKVRAQLASRVQADPDDSILSPDNDSESDADYANLPPIPPILSSIYPSTPNAPLIRRIDTTPLLLSISLLLAKTPSIEESATGKMTTATSPFAHLSKVAATASIAQKTTISRSDTLIDSNTTVASQCVIKSSVIGSSVTIGLGARLTNCLVMDGAVIGDKCVLTGTVIGKKAKVGKNCTLNNCEVQDGNVLSERTEGKGEKYLIGGLEDEIEDADFGDRDDEGQDDVEEILEN